MQSINVIPTLQCGRIATCFLQILIFRQQLEELCTLIEIVMILMNLNRNLKIIYIQYTLYL